MWIIGIIETSRSIRETLSYKYDIGRLYQQRAFKAMLFYLELDLNQTDEDLVILDFYLKDNQAIMIKQRHIQSITISIHIFKMRKGEYKEEMSDMKFIVSLMTEVSVGEESIGIEISDSF